MAIGRNEFSAYDEIKKALSYGIKEALTEYFDISRAEVEGLLNDIKAVELAIVEYEKDTYQLNLFNENDVANNFNSTAEREIKIKKDKIQANGELAQHKGNIVTAIKAVLAGNYISKEQLQLLIQEFKQVYVQNEPKTTCMVQYLENYFTEKQAEKALQEKADAFFKAKIDEARLQEKAESKRREKDEEDIKAKAFFEKADGIKVSSNSTESGTPSIAPDSSGNTKKR